MAHAMSRARVSNAPASRSLAGCSGCDSFDGTLVLEVHGMCPAVEEVEIATAVEAWAVDGSSSPWVDLQPTRPCCNLPGHSEQDNLIVVRALASDAGI